MTRLKYFISFALILVTQQVYAQNDLAIEKMRALDWKVESGTYQLENGDASIITYADELLVIGKEAHKFMFLSEGYDGIKPDAAIIRIEGPDQETQVFYSFHELGFIKMDDWDDQIEKNSLLQEIKDLTEISNEKREPGYASLHVDNWVQEPYLDKINAIIYWAIALHSSEGIKIVNAKAIKLGRKGFTEIIWVGTAEQFSGIESSLSPALAAYEFNEGSMYADFMPDVDTAAAFGAGALTYKMITGKAVAKVGAGLAVVLLAFVKKFWILIFIPFLFAWKKVKGFFVEKKED